MSSIGDGFKNIFLAGIGAMAYTGEKGKEIIDQLVDKGEITLDQGRELNEELRRKADGATKGMRESALEAAMKAMSPAEREAFAAKAAEFAKVQNEADAQAAVGDPVVAVVEAVEDVVEAAAGAVEDVAHAAADVVKDVAQKAEDAVKDMTQTAEDTAKDAEQAVEEAVEDVEQAVEEAVSKIEDDQA